MLDKQGLASVPARGMSAQRTNVLRAYRELLLLIRRLPSEQQTARLEEARRAGVCACIAPAAAATVTATHLSRIPVLCSAGKCCGGQGRRAGRHAKGDGSKDLFPENVASESALSLFFIPSYIKLRLVLRRCISFQYSSLPQ